MEGLTIDHFSRSGGWKMPSVGTTAIPATAVGSQGLM